MHQKRNTPCMPFQGEASMPKLTNTIMTLTAFALLAAPAAAQNNADLKVQDDGTITTRSFDLPFSSFASPEARDAYVKRLRVPPQPRIADIEEVRRNSDEKLRPQYELIRTMYPASSTRATIGGVPTETFVPTAGVSAQNRGRILIELHGGGFVAGGGGMTGAISALPIASVGRIKVISVDYRMAPEHRFPAASEDLATVYRHLLKTYKPQNIGLFGCSAGGFLAAEAIPWFLKEKLPLPGAIGVFCASAHSFAEGDSAQLWTRMGSVLPIVPPAKPDGSMGDNLYFRGTRAGDPLVVPAASTDVLRAFPPTLFLTGTRAPEMSGAAQSHLELLDLGRTSELALFDGMDHGFFSDATLPESQRAYRLIVRFFDSHLGRR
jgi:acetyl esterase/lipase